MVVTVTRVVTRVVLVVFEEATNHNHCEQSCSRNQRDIGLEHLQDPGVVPHKRNLTGGAQGDPCHKRIPTLAIQLCWLPKRT